MIQILAVLTVSFFITGCSRLRYLEEALRLKAYSQEQESIAADIAQRDALFDRMLSRIGAGEDLTLLGTGRALQELFGTPVLKNPVPSQEGQEEWLYRYQVNRTDAPKVYFLIGSDNTILGVRSQGAL